MELVHYLVRYVIIYLLYKLFIQLLDYIEIKMIDGNDNDR